MTTIETAEHAVLRRAVMDIEAWVVELPASSSWREAFLTARREIAAVVASRALHADSIGGLVMSVRTYNALVRAGVSTVAQLEQACGDGTLGSLPRIGPAAVYEIENMLANLQLERMFEGGGE